MTGNADDAELPAQWRGHAISLGDFYHSPAQEEVAAELIAELAAGKVFHNPIVTEVAAAPVFLCRRGQSPGIFRQQWPTAVLSVRCRAEIGQVPPEICRPGKKMTPVREYYYSNCFLLS
jgi:hypothetical protein